MEIIKTSIDWAKAEIFSSSFFIVFGLVFVAVSIGFWQLGKTDLAKAYVIPTAVAGLLLLTIGIGLVYANKTRNSSFAEDFKKDAPAFVQSEIERVDGTLKEYKYSCIYRYPINHNCFCSYSLFCKHANMESN